MVGRSIRSSVRAVPIRYPAPAGGYTYIGLLIFLAILALVSAATLTTGSLMQRRANEEELLYIGGQFAAAFRSYADATPVGQRPVPAKLEDLLRDPRYPGVRRHLRRIHTDPITGRAEWGLMAAPGGGVMGVHSLSEEAPIKVAEFEPAFAALTGKERYRDWVFGYAPPGFVPAGTVTLSGVAPGAGGRAPASGKPLPGSPPVVGVPGGVGESWTPTVPAALSGQVPSPASADRPSPAATDLPPPELGLAAPQRARVGSVMQVRVTFPPASAVRSAEVVVEFDPAVLQPLAAGVGESGRITVSVRSVSGVRAPGPVVVQFRAVGDAGRTTEVHANATAVDAAGGPVPVAQPVPRVIEID
jgi:type II secretory pathway pseudopilin PulG